MVRRGLIPNLETVELFVVSIKAADKGKRKQMEGEVQAVEEFKACCVERGLVLEIKMISPRQVKSLHNLLGDYLGVI